MRRWIQSSGLDGLIRMTQHPWAFGILMPDAAKPAAATLEPLRQLPHP